MSKLQYNVYMQKVDKNGNPLEASPVDIEKQFVGLRYSSAKGLNTIGKAKNIYVENYADSEKSRVYIPKDVANENTKVKLKLYFTGENRESAYDAFNAYIRDGFHKFWDTVRKKYFIFYLGEEINVSEEKFIGSTPYFEVEYTLNNIFGKTYDVK